MTFEDLKRYMLKMAIDINAVSEKALNVTSEKIRNEAKKNAPVNTGMLRKSIIVEQAPLLRVIGSTVDYAIFVEYETKPATGNSGGREKESIMRWGHLHGLTDAESYAVYKKIIMKGTKAQPFLVPAFDRFSGDLEKDFTKAVQDAIK